MEHDQLLALGIVRPPGDGQGDLPFPGGGHEAQERLLDRAVRHHLAADLGEARETSLEMQEAVIVEPAEVARDIPAVAVRLGGAHGVVEIAGEEIGAPHEQEAGGAGGHLRAGVGVDEAHGDAVDGAADGPGPVAAPSAAGRARVGEVGDVHREDGARLGRAVAL